MNVQMCNMNILIKYLNLFMASLVGVFSGYSIYSYMDFKMHPEIYAMQSAPWYTGIEIFGIFACCILFIGTIMKIILQKKK